MREGIVARAGFGLLFTALLVLAVAYQGRGKASDPQADLDQRLGAPARYQGDLPSLSALNLRTARLESLYTGLEEPWAFEFLSDREVLVTERKGRLLRVGLGEEPTVQAIAGLPEIASDRQQTGLLDVALHPDFASNGRVYFSYVSADEATGRYYLTAVARATLSGAALTDLKVILEAGPHGWSPSNFGGALSFLPDRTLLVSIGDRSERDLAQRGDRLQGKILRLTDDGEVPADNPFLHNSDVDDRVWALGLRNVQGLDVDPESGRVFAASHGPMGGDEINLIRPGHNYGWPVVTYGRSYTTERIGEGTHAEGMTQPLFYYLPSEAISPLAVYRGDMFEDWDGDLLIGALKGQHVSRVDVDDTQVRSEYPILGEIGDRIRDIRIASDGAVWLLGQNTGLWRLSLGPEPELPEQPVNGADVYTMACAGCHDVGAGGAPMLRQGCRWQALGEKGLEQLVANTVAGVGNMPERGLCEICEDRHLEAAVSWMLDEAADCVEPAMKSGQPRGTGPGGR